MTYYDSLISTLKDIPALALVLLAISTFIVVIPLLDYIERIYVKFKVKNLDIDYEYYYNSRFGFKLLLPRHWDNSHPPSNSDGTIAKHPKFTKVSITSFGSHITSMDKNDYKSILLTLETQLRENKSINQIRTVESTIQTEIDTDEEKGKVTLIGSRFEYQTNLLWRHSKILHFVYLYRGKIYEIICSSPHNQFKMYENAFMEIGKSIVIVDGVDRY